MKYFCAQKSIFLTLYGVVKLTIKEMKKKVKVTLKVLDNVISKHLDTKITSKRILRWFVKDKTFHALVILF